MTVPVAWPEPDARNARMVQLQLERSWHGHTIDDARVLDAFRRVDRAWFVPDEFQHQAYDDHPLPIGGGQTISQPWIVAHQLQLLRLRGHERVLEVGTGCGYVTALLAGLAQEVWSIERLAPLHAAACSVLLDRLACPNIHLRLGDGSVGWPEAAPFDAILVAAAAPRIPRPLVEQLAVGGRLCLPVEEDHQPGDQRMTLVVRTGPAADNLRTERHVGCRFVRLIGAAGWAPEADI